MAGSKCHCITPSSLNPTMKRCPNGSWIASYRNMGFRSSEMQSKSGNLPWELSSGLTKICMKWWKREGCSKAMVSMHARSSWALILVHAIVFEILRDHCIRNMYNEKMLLFVGVKYFINACACECLMVSCSCDIKSISNLLWLSAFERKLITKNHNFVSNNN